MPYHVPLPPKWSQEQLEAQRQTALVAFVAERTSEGTDRYEKLFAENLEFVRRLFHESSDLLALSGHVFESDPALLSAARYLAAPPISKDDLDALAGGKVTGRKALDGDLASRAAAAIRSSCDPMRLPWLAENRSPTSGERETALRWTAGIWAVEEMRTYRRTDASKRQERIVELALHDKGWQRQIMRRIDTLEDLPRGSFSSEALLGGSKCDIPIRLHDGRLLAIECKVSNSAINSVKRLNREVGGKADQWRRAFGEQVIPAAVLSGVFKLHNLVEAQDRQSIAIFWTHELGILLDFASSAV
jgi:hypothetical protein